MSNDIDNIKQAISDLEASHLRSITSVQSMDPNKLTIQTEESWSVIQVFAHLNESESGAVRYIKKKMQSVDLKRAGFATQFRSMLLMLLLKSPFKFKIPGVLGQPGNDASIEDLAGSFQRNITDLYDLVEVLGDEGVRKEIFKHPVLGRLTFHQTIKFLTAHFDRHFSQITTIKSRLS